MAVVEAVDGGHRAIVDRETTPPKTGPPRDLQRTFQLILATIWLLDAVLQIQPFMFTPVERVQRNVERDRRVGTPAGWPTRSRGTSRSIPPTGSDQFGLCRRPVRHRLRHRLAEVGQACTGALGRVGPRRLVVRGRAGGVFQGGATPFSGGPGGVLFYAVLAVFCGRVRDRSGRSWPPAPSA